MLFKASPRKSVKFKHHVRLQEWYSFQLAETTASDQVSNTHTELLTILAPIRETEGPKNVQMKMVALKVPKDRHR